MNPAEPVPRAGLERIRRIHGLRSSSAASRHADRRAAQRRGAGKGGRGASRRRDIAAQAG